MVKAIDLIGSNTQLQNHWARRIFAAIIDLVIVSFIGWVILLLLLIASIEIPLAGWLAMVIVSLLWLVYSAFLEGLGGATIGKRLINLMIVSTEGQMTLSKAFIRNITKVFWLLPLIDWLVGFMTDGDPRQRFFDRIADTTVVRTDAQEIFPGAYQPPSGPMPTPIRPQPHQYQAPAPSTPQQGYAARPEEIYEPPPPEEMIEEKVEPVAEEAEEEFTREELVNMRKDDLKKIARDRGLRIAGTKRDLIDRILGEEEG